MYTFSTLATRTQSPHVSSICVSAGESSDYEEAKQIEFKRAADDLQPALLLMLGSFTQFVR